MNRRARLGQLITASSTDHKQHRLRESLEPLEERMMLTALTWTIDQAQSDVTIAIPDQPFELDDGMGTVYTGMLKIRNQGGSDGGPWNIGNAAEIAGTIATDYVDGSSIEFLLGQSNISGVNSGSYIPDAANWNGTDFGGSLAPGAGVFGGRLYPSINEVFGLSLTVGHFNFTDVLFDVDSAALPISSGSFAANTTDIGISSATANLKGTAVLPPLVGQLLPDAQVMVIDLLDTNQAPTGTVTSPDPINQPDLRQLTFPILQNFSLELSPDTPPFTGSITGQIVATATLPPPLDSTVTDRRLYYNNSGYDGNTSGAVSAAQEYSALASDKSAYLPGSGTFTAANTSSFSKGITGAIVELTGTHGTLTADDFTVLMSGQQLAANNTPSSWTAAPAPTVTVFSDTPVAGTDRVHLTWADGAIADRYLEIIVEGNDAAGGNNTNTGLATSDIHLYANKIGDDFTGSPTFSNTNATDELNARNSQGTADLAATNAYDFNRDFFVNSTDQLIARNNQGFLQWLSFSNPPAAPAPPGDADSADSAIASALAAASDAEGTPAAANWLAQRLDDATSEPSAVAPPVVAESAGLVQSPVGNDASDAAVDEALDENLLDSLLDELLS